MCDLKFKYLSMFLEGDHSITNWLCNKWVTRYCTSCISSCTDLYNVILSSDKWVIMKIITSAQVMYYFTSAKHEWNNTLRVHKWLFSLSRVYQTTITLSYYLFNNCFKYNFHYLRGWQWMNSLSPLVWIMKSLSLLVMIMT